MNKLITILLPLLLTSCLKEELTYEVYKSKKTKNSTSSMMANAEGIKKEDNKSLKWNAPKEWKEKATNSIRIGSYDLPNIDSKKAELSIIILAGDGGGIVANINRWRDQIGLSELDSVSIEKSLSNITGKLGQYKYTEIINGDKSISAAFIMHSDKTIYIKASGHSEVIASQAQAFKDFIKGIHENK